ncbi:MAG: ComF family protein [Acidobacteria bacterium]|nr:MAG: ComF family protein [Acidobacteriota bacterium]REJ98932.1 MAG: ComF family protein [Acidobacteriota bacterium]REK16348.1 MAG: ComF family protein [Acidobacteriota bacterium]REK44029.1 MAG: ComF family protein [Acidobacteriota bacterium]
MIDRILDPLLTLAFPRACSICGGCVESLAFGPACDSCWDKTKIYTGRESCCSKCGLLVPTGRFDLTSRCSRCVEDHYDRAVAAAEYDFAAKAAVLALKEEPLISQRVRDLIVGRFDTSGFHSATMLIPVPLSERRKIERGFNQAELLAQVLDKHTGIPSVSDVLERSGHFGMHRAGMDKKAREASVKNSFAVAKPRRIAEERVILVDDVFTTGSTASACAQTLKASAAAEVNVLTLARTPWF